MATLRIAKKEHGVVMSHPGADRIPAAAASVKQWGSRCQHYGWPGITRTLEGDILVSASERIRHVDPFGRTVVARSDDGGHTWGEPQVVFDSVTDDRDHALNTLPDGTVVSTWFSSQAWTNTSASYWLPAWQEIRDRLTADTLHALSRGWLRRSHDGGRTWEESVYPTLVGQHAGPSVLANGDMIYCGRLAGPKGPQLVATRSGDGGLTWAVVGEIPCATFTREDGGGCHTLFNENHALEIGPGRILCAFRAAREPRNVHIARTTDGGRTWTAPEDIGVYGFPSHLLRLAAGPILCVFGDRRGPWAIRAVLSYDDGMTWDADNVLTLWESPVVVDMGYPVALEINAGEVLCAFYSVPVPDMTPDYGTYDVRNTGILSTRIWLG